MRQFWTTTEIRHALKMRERGLSYGQIALKLGRTIASVSAQLREQHSFHRRNINTSALGGNSDLGA
jgi:transcriptional regulator